MQLRSLGITLCTGLLFQADSALFIDPELEDPTEDNKRLGMVLFQKLHLNSTWYSYDLGIHLRSITSLLQFETK